MNRQDSGLKKRIISLQYSILIPFIFLFAVTAVVSSLLFLKASSDDIERQVATYQEMILEQAALKLENFMEKPHLMNASVSKALNNDKELYNDLPRMRMIFLDYLSVFPTVMAGALGVESSGNFISAGRYIKGGFDSAIYQHEVSTRYNYYRLDDQGQPYELITSRDSYNLKERSWYKLGVNAGKPAWSSIYTFAANSEIGLTAVRPVYNDNQLAGVLQSAFSLSFINEFLKEIPMEGDHKIVIYDSFGSLLGTSEEIPVIVRDSEGTLNRVHIADISDPVIRTAYEAEALTLASVTGETVPFSAEGNDYYLRIMPFSGEYDLRWTLAVTDNRDDFTVGIVAAFFQNLLIIIFASLFCMIIGVVILRRLIKPLLELSRSVKAFSDDYQIGDFKIAGPGEIYELSRGFYHMADHIRQTMDGLESDVKEKAKELEVSQDHVKTLSGLVPICSECKSIRDDKGFWNQIESYVEHHSDAFFSHSLCPKCADKLYGDQDWYKKGKKPS